jgi:hypothetical protein
MKTGLKHTALAAAVTLGIIASQLSYAESVHTVTEQRQVAAFSSVELSGPYRVAIRASGKPGVELSGEHKQVQEVETVVHGDTLIVRPVKRTGVFFGIERRRDAVTVNISATTLNSLKTSGSGDVDLDQLAGDRFNVAVSGAGDLRAAGAVRQLVVTSSGSGDVDLHRLKAADVDLTMSGPGDVRLAGVGNEQRAKVSGAGDLVADDLRLTRTTAQISGPGNAPPPQRHQPRAAG